MGKDAEKMRHRLRDLRGQLRKLLPLVDEMIEAGEVREAETPYTVPQGEETGGPAGERFRIEHYGPRFWGLYEGDTLLAVTVYKRGAETVRDRLQAQDTRIAELTRALGARDREGIGSAGHAGAVERLQEERKGGGRDR